MSLTSNIVFLAALVALFASSAQGACENPISPLQASVESSLTVAMSNSLVTFHTLVEHQTNSTSGSYVTGTAITFGAGSVCDFPGTNFLGLQSLDTNTCMDDYAFTDVGFSTFSPCLVLTCLDNNGSPLASCDPALCTTPPCSKRWANSVKISRSYSVFNDLNVAFPVTSTAYHPVEFQFPWIQSTSFNSAVWSTPNVGGSAVITSVIYDTDNTRWTVVVSSSLAWPYRLVKPVSTDTINGQVYTVSACASTPVASIPCVQTTTFNVPGCTGLNDLFNGVATAFTGLNYECADPSSPNCPLTTNEMRAANITIVLDSNAPCGPVKTETIIVQSDLTFHMKQPNYSVNRTSFIEGDVLNFRLDISKSIPTAAISSITVVSFKESTLHNSIALATNKVTTPTNPCGTASTLCFNFDTTQLTALPDNEAKTDLVFVVIVQINFSGVSKKRAILEVSNFQLSTEASVIQDTTSGSEKQTAVSNMLLGTILVSSLVSYLHL